MNGNVRIARLLGIPIIVNLSWLVTLAFVTSMLALRFYPNVIPVGSPYRNDIILHWVMALSSGLAFFASILLHELAHSVVAMRQGIPVKNITLFIFGGVSQISAEARRPRDEFIMALVGPLTSVLIAGACFLVWWATSFSGRSPIDLINGLSSGTPFGIVLEWLFVMNLVVAVFNMVPGFPMDGGRVLRSILWGITGNLYRATRMATIVGRSVGYGLMFLGGMAFFGTISFIDPWSGVWFAILGLFLESSARQSWLQMKALNVLSQYHAGDIMSSELETAAQDDRLGVLADRGGRRYIYFVSDADEHVVGVVTEKEFEELAPARKAAATAGEAMVRSENATVATTEEDGAVLLQRMEEASVWHLPIVSEGRVIGVVSKESLLRLLARNLLPPQSRLAAGQR